MNYYHAQTVITGDVTGRIRCHQNAKGVIANFSVQVVTPWGSGPPHTELYRCVAFGRTGVEVQQNLQAGQVVQCSGFMRTSAWADGSGKENHQLICNSVEIDGRSSSVNHQPRPPEPKQDTQSAITAPALPENKPPVPRKVKARTYGKHSRKPRQTDFTAVLDEPEPFNDELPPL